MTSSLKQSANKLPLTLSNNTPVANYSHYFQCNWHSSKLSFFPRGHHSSNKGCPALISAPMPKTCLPLAGIWDWQGWTSSFRLGPGAYKWVSGSSKPEKTGQTKVVTGCRNLEGRRGTGTASENCFLGALGITAPNCSGLHNILLGHYWHCCSSGSHSPKNKST